MDYPRDLVVPTHINPWTDWMNGNTLRGTGGLGGLSSITWTANQAVYIPMRLPFNYHVQRAFWCNGSTVAGSSDVAIYSSSGVRLWSAGSTVNSGAIVPQYITVTGGLLLTPGHYWMAFASSTTTTGVTGVALATADGRVSGLKTQATALPLPATATLAAYAGVGVPLIGITNTASGF